MELPALTMEEWRGRTTHKEVPDLVTRRISSASLAHYYPDYVRIMGLQDNFVENTVVTSVRQVQVDEEVMATKMEAIAEGIPFTRRESLQEVFCLDEESVSDTLSSRCSSMTGLHRGAGSLSSISVDSSAPPPSCTPSLPSPADRLRPSSEYSCSLQCDYEDCDFLCSWNPIMNPVLFGSYKSSVACSTSIQDSAASLPKSWRRQYSAPGRLPHHPAAATRPLFEVTGYRTMEGGQEPFKYLARNVVLATGQADTPNRLGVAGEELPFVLHSLPELEAAITAGKVDAHSAPVLVVGAGLSSADAVISVQGHGLPVCHVFRKSVDDPQLIFAKLPKNLYPEYHAVHAMMAGGHSEGEQDGGAYRAWAETEVVRITEDHRVVIKGPSASTTLQVSYVVVLIGACPNLSFLTTPELGRMPGQAIDRNNPIDIEVFSHQSVNVPGLFALGPLAGDNFVRFIQGGALAIASHAHQQHLEERA